MQGTQHLLQDYINQDSAGAGHSNCVAQRPFTDTCSQQARPANIPAYAACLVSDMLQPTDLQCVNENNLSTGPQSNMHVL